MLAWPGSRYHSGISCLVRGVVSDHCFRIYSARPREKATANKIRGRSQGDPGTGGGRSAAALRSLRRLLDLRLIQGCPTWGSLAIRTELAGGEVMKKGGGRLQAVAPRGAQSGGISKSEKGCTNKRGSGPPSRGPETTRVRAYPRWTRHSGLEVPGSSGQRS